MIRRALAPLLTIALSSTGWAENLLVLQSDFGTKDGAVAAMKGVALGVSPALTIHDLTHEIPAYNVWEAALRLEQTAEYWPAGTVFVSVVDPGVGTARKSVVLKTGSGHYFVTPDNGTLTFVAARLGIAEVREIDEVHNRRKDSEQSYTFHGRDVYAYTGARLAAGVITMAQVGSALKPEVVSIDYQKARFEGAKVYGNIPILDIQFGNVWTNIPSAVFAGLGLEFGDLARVRITHAGKPVLDLRLPFLATFGQVEIGESLLYLNSLNNVALAINQGSFAQAHRIQSGPQWSIEISKVDQPQEE